MICVYIFLLLIVLYDIKIYKAKKYNSEFLGIKNATAMKGLAVILVILNHISEGMENPGILTPFRYLGEFAVDIFLFFSGYGLMVSYNSKNDYLQSFWSKRILKVLIPFITANIVFILMHIINKEFFSTREIFFYVFGIRLIDSFKWYVINIIFLYICFYFSFKYIKSKTLAIIALGTLIMIYNVVCRMENKGIWWYDANHCFFIGILVGQNVNSIYNFIKKNYKIALTTMILIFLIFFIIEIKTEGILLEIVALGTFNLILLMLLMKISIENRLLFFLGRISYEIYLIHRITLDLFIGINKYEYIILCIIISVILAYIFNIICRFLYNNIYSILDCRYIN